MYARGKLALALSLTLIAGTLQAAPWERASSKIQTDTSAAQSRRSSRAYSYNPAATSTAPTLAQPQAAVRTPMAQTVVPRIQPAPSANLAPTTVAPRQPTTTYAPNQVRSYRSNSYQPSNSSGTTARTRLPFFMRADSKVMGREGVF